MWLFFTGGNENFVMTRNQLHLLAKAMNLTCWLWTETESWSWILKSNEVLLSRPLQTHWNNSKNKGHIFMIITVTYCLQNGKFSLSLCLKTWLMKEKQHLNWKISSVQNARSTCCPSQQIGQNVGEVWNQPIMSRIFQHHLILQQSTATCNLLDGRLDYHFVGKKISLQRSKVIGKKSKKT